MKIENVLGLSDDLIELYDFFVKYSPSWSKDVEELQPMIVAIMEETGETNPIKAIMPVLKEAKEDGNHKEAQLILALALDLVLGDK